MDFKNLIIFTLSSLLIFGGCSDAPDQYDVSSPDLPTDEDRNRNSASPQGINPLVTSGTLTPVQDDLVRANSKKDIIYKDGVVGVAGITVDTTSKESRDILSIPERMVKQDDATEVGVYNEGLYIFWRRNIPRVPSMVIITKDYQGSLNAGGTIGDLRVGDDLKKYFTKTDPDAEYLLRTIFNKGEGKDSSYDCFKTDECSTKRFKDAPFSLHISPRIMFMVSNDRKALSEIRLIKKTLPGVLGTTFNIITGEFVNEGKKVYGIGQKFSELVSLQDEPGMPMLDTGEISILYGEVYTSYVRTNFDRNIFNPSGDDIVSGFHLLGNFKKELGLEGVYDNGFLSMVPEGVLKLKTKIATKKDQLDFIEKFNSSIKSKISSLISGTDIVITTKVEGKFNLSSDTSFDTEISWLSPSKGTGDILSYNLGKVQGNIDYLFRGKLVDPFNKITFPGKLSDIDFKVEETKENKGRVGSLFGIKLGQKVTISEIDIVKEAATAEISIDGTTYYKSRVSFVDDGLLPSFYEGDSNVNLTRVKRIRVSDLGVALSMVQIGAKEYKVIGIGGSFLKSAKNLCGLDSFSAKTTDGAEDTLNQILKLLDEKQKYSPEFKCEYLIERAKDGSDQIEAIYFAKDRAILTFSDGELSSILIYTKPEEV